MKGEPVTTILQQDFVSVSNMIAWFKKKYVSRDKSKHRVYTILYEDLCM